MFSVLFLCICASFFASLSQGILLYNGIECTGKIFRNVTLSAYYPNDESESEEGNLDMRGKQLNTLQDFLDDQVNFITLAMDPELKMPYGTVVCIPELNRHFNRRLNIQVRDTGSEVKRSYYSRAEICVRAEADSYDNAVNRVVTLIF